MRYCFILVLFILSCCALQAQQESYSTDFQQMRQELLNEYDDFRKEINEEYANFLSQAWEEFRLFKAIPLYEEPKPDAPYRYDKSHMIEKEVEIPIKEVIEQKPSENVLAEEKPFLETDDIFEENPFSVYYYGANLKLRYKSSPYSLSSIQEIEVGRLWKEFSETRFTHLLADMQNYKKKMQMNDWAYYLLTGKVATQLSALKDENSRLIFQHFLLVQSGYDVRLAKTDNFFVLLVPIRETVYEYPYLQLEGKPYYVISDRKLSSYSSLFTYKLPDNLKTGQTLSLALTRQLLIPMQAKEFSIEGAGIKAEGKVNLNQIQFYRDYPKCSLLIHSKAKPGKELEEGLIQSFRKQTTGKDTLSIINQLLLWIQTGFKYQTDKKQFGFEKPFFIEENFYYPYNDCEDRAILFAFLVKKLLKLDVMLLDYPNHIATAVCMPYDVKGDYLMHRKKKFIICDPTFINAQAGRCMPRYKTVKAEIIDPAE